MTTHFRVAFQGGGANFITLLAASKAVFDLHHNEESSFRVSKISGTSAGSLVAGVLASGLDPEQVRVYLKKNGQARLTEVIETPERGLLWSGYVSKAISLASGNPFFEHSKLVGFVDEIIRLNDPEVEKKMKDLSIPAMIATTDLSTGKVKYWDSEDEDKDTREKPLKWVIGCSCAIPGVFKGLTDDDKQYVDGGLVENLPLDALTKDYSPNRVLGFSFVNEEEIRTNSLPKYFGAILGAMIGSNVRHSTKSIPEDNLFRIPCSYGTLDFEEALNEGLNHLYDKVRDNVRHSLERVVEREERRAHEGASRSRFSRNFDAQKSAEQLYDAFHSDDVTILSIETEWRLDSLRNPIDREHNELNPLVTKYEIERPKSEGLFVFRVFLNSLTDKMVLTMNEIDVSDIDGNKIEFTPLVGKVREFQSSFEIPIFLYIDLSKLSKSCHKIVIKHRDYVSDNLPKFMSPKSDNEKSYEAVGMVCNYPRYEKVVWTVHIPESIHKLCDFNKLDSLDEAINVESFAEGSLNIDYSADVRTPMNFKTVRWESDGQVSKNQAAGFAITKATEAKGQD